MVPQRLLVVNEPNQNWFVLGRNPQEFPNIANVGY
jgi:hypothetical protein